MREMDLISYGKVLETSYFEEQLRISSTDEKDKREFGFAISHIRRELEKEGFYLNGRGQEGKSYTIIPPKDNRKVMKRYQDEAIDCLTRAATLGMTTDTSTLSDEEKRKHEHTLNVAATRLILMKRSTRVARFIEKNNGQKLLK